jgi:hypothetical protein
MSADPGRRPKILKCRLYSLRVKGPDFENFEGVEGVSIMETLHESSWSP